MSDYKNLDVSPAVHEAEWRVRIEQTVQAEERGTHAAVAFLSPTEAKDLSQRLFHLALEISEREGTPQGGETVEQLRTQLREAERALVKERSKRLEVVRHVAPKEKLEAAKAAIVAVLAGGEPRDLNGEEVKADALRAALSWLEEFKA